MSDPALPGPPDPLLTRRARLTERAIKVAGVALLIGAIFMVPWTIYLAATLPSHVHTHRYDLAWAGFDVMLCLSLLATSLSALRSGRLLPALAASTATFLLVDAWFDVVTAPDQAALETALAMAVVVELPIAIACALISLRAQQVNDARAMRAARARMQRFLPRERHKADSGMR